MAFGGLDWNYYLNQKYDIQQQAQDAEKQRVAILAKNAATQALTGAAAAKLDTTRANLMPAESAASIARTRAETGLIGEQTRYFGPTAEANIANTNANTYFTGIQGDVAKREGLTERTILPESLAAVMGGRYSGFRLGSDVAPARSTGTATSGWKPRFPGDLSAAMLDRLNGL